MDYVQHLWREQADREQHQRTAFRIAAWILGSAVAVSLAAYVSRDYWYAYLTPYL
jgi:hypothetical protein